MPTRTSFYVVQHPETGIVKVGVTDARYRPRLGNHYRNGFTLWLGVLEGVKALILEAQLLTLLHEEGFRPVKGREYFAAEALPLIRSFMAGTGTPVTRPHPVLYAVQRAMQGDKK